MAGDFEDSCLFWLMVTIFSEYAGVSLVFDHYKNFKNPLQSQRVHEKIAKLELP